MDTVKQAHFAALDTIDAGEKSYLIESIYLDIRWIKTISPRTPTPQGLEGQSLRALRVLSREYKRALRMLLTDNRGRIYNGLKKLNEQKVSFKSSLTRGS